MRIRQWVEATRTIEISRSGEHQIHSGHAGMITAIIEYKDPTKPNRYRVAWARKWESCVSEHDIKGTA